MFGYGGFWPGWGGYFGPGWGPMPGGVPGIVGGVIDDSEIASYVRDNIDLDPYIPVRDKNAIDVNVEGGTVTLSGTASRRSKGLAYADAFWAPGVLDVVNNIETKEGEEVKSPTEPKRQG